MIFAHVDAPAQVVDLGTAGNFAILAGSAITATGATVINGGDVGLSSGAAISGFPPATLAAPYTTHLADAVALQAQNDLTSAYNTAAGLLPHHTLTSQDLGGLTLTPGVYFFASSAELTGKLTLDNQGNPDAVFVFQIGSTLTTAVGSSIVTTDQGSGFNAGADVFWQIGSSATLDTGSQFEGNILAATSITADAGATVDGRLLAENGAVTLDDTTVTAPQADAGSGGGVPAPDNGSSTLLFLSGCFATLMLFRRRVLSS